MPSDDGSDLVTAIATAIAKQVPVRDALKPAASELGAFGSDLIKCVRLALAPVQYFAVQQDRYRRFIEESAQRVPQDRRIEPAPQVLGPVLEGMRYEPEHSISDDAFSELLSRAFDRERVGQAHPAFPGIIRSLSDDELRLLRALAPLDPRPHPPTDVPVPVISTLGFGIVHPENVSLYLAHLGSLGLTVQPFGFDPSHCAVIVDNVRTYMLSNWGKAFAIAVTAPSQTDAN